MVDEIKSLKPVTDEQVFYDKFLCDKLSFICSSVRATLTSFSMTSKEKIVKVQICSSVWVNKENLSK
jgi:hypothetical protein